MASLAARVDNSVNASAVPSWSTRTRSCLTHFSAASRSSAVNFDRRVRTVKAFATLDGHGLKLLAQAGIVPIVVTGRDSAAVRRRVADLGLAHAVYGAHDKLAAATQQLGALGIEWPDLAVIGDDWPDLPLLQRAGFACASANAHAEVRAVADHVTALPGGHGAAREFCDLLLMASGRYAALLRGDTGTLDAR